MEIRLDYGIGRSLLLPDDQVLQEESGDQMSKQSVHRNLEEALALSRS